MLAFFMLIAKQQKKMLAFKFFEASPRTPLGDSAPPPPPAPCCKAPSFVAGYAPEYARYVRVFTKVALITSMTPFEHLVLYWAWFGPFLRLLAFYVNLRWAQIWLISPCHLWTNMTLASVLSKMKQCHLTAEWCYSKVKWCHSKSMSFYSRVMSSSLKENFKTKA